MNFHRIVTSSAAVLAVAACSAPPTDASGSDTQAIAATWLADNVPAGSVSERKVLDLVNDSTMFAGQYVNECGFSQNAADAVLAYRYGDDLSSSGDNRWFTSARDLDALPFTDEPFWSAALRCSRTHVAGPPVCVSPSTVIELVIDESASMSGEKWEATRSAVQGLYASLRALGNPKILVGAVHFQTEVTAELAPAPITDTAHFDALSARLAEGPITGSTGTRKALDTAYRLVRESEPVYPAAKRFVVLLSDGVPDGGDEEQAASVELADKAFLSITPVLTYAVGIGPFPAPTSSSYDAAFMGRLALHGGTGPAGCDPDATDLAHVCHVQITPGASTVPLEAALSHALDEIRRQVAVEGCP